MRADRLFKLIERFAFRSQTKGRPEKKPKTTGIKRPVVAIETAMKARPASSGSALPRAETKRTLTFARVGVFADGRMTLPYRVLYACFSSTGGLFSLQPHTQRHQLIPIALFLRCWSPGWSADVRAAIRGAVQQRFRIRAVRAPVISFWVMRGCHTGASVVSRCI